MYIMSWHFGDGTLLGWGCGSDGGAGVGTQWEIETGVWEIETYWKGIGVKGGGVLTRIRVEKKLGFKLGRYGVWSWRIFCDLSLSDPNLDSCLIVYISLNNKRHHQNQQSLPP